MNRRVLFNCDCSNRSIMAVYERAWSRMASYGYFKIDDALISQGSGRAYGGSEITQSILSPNTFHTISIQGEYGGHDYGVCILILYS